MRKSLSELLGWYGVGAILIAYFLNTFGLLNTSSFYYSILNLTGALGIIVDAWKQKNYQPVVLNIVWGVSSTNSFNKSLIYLK